MLTSEMPSQKHRDGDNTLNEPRQMISANAEAIRHNNAE